MSTCWRVIPIRKRLSPQRRAERGTTGDRLQSILTCKADAASLNGEALDARSAYCAFCSGGAIVLTLMVFAGTPATMLYGGTSFDATPIEPTIPCSAIRTPLITVA
jgi:hypothetical protein